MIKKDNILEIIFNIPELKWTGYNVSGRCM